MESFCLYAYGLIDDSLRTDGYALEDYYPHTQTNPQRGCAMTNDGIARAPRWKELYRQAMLETDLAKPPSIIADADKALLDRIEETLTQPVSAEREELGDALSGLRSLRQELNFRPKQTDGDGPGLRKTG
jgi:hypothetical protein